MNDDLILAALVRLETKLDGISAGLSRTREEILPRLAVLEEGDRERTAKGDRRWQARLAVALSVLALVGSFVQPFLGG